MNNKFLASPLPALLAAFAILSAGTVHAAEEDVSKADPQRWYQEDNSPKGRLQNLNKETTAAYAEALQACKSMKGKDAAACRQQAAQARSQDAARAQRIFKDYQGDAPAAASARKGTNKPPHKHGAMPAAK